MTKLKNHLNDDTALKTLFTNCFSHHPEHYIEIIGVLRKYELHHIITKFMLGHHQEEEDENILLLTGPQKEDDHAEGLAKALEELGPCFIASLS